MENIYTLKFLAFILAGILFILLLFALALAKKIKAFNEERCYIKMEIRNAGKTTVLYWKRQLRWLYITHIPLVGPFLARLFKK